MSATRWPATATSTASPMPPWWSTARSTRWDLERALEDLKGEWRPPRVRRHGSIRSGNPELVRRGGHWLGDDLSSLAALMDVSRDPPPTSRASIFRCRSRAQKLRRRRNLSRDPRRWGAGKYTCRAGASARTGRRPRRRRGARSGRDGSLRHVPDPAARDHGRSAVGVQRDRAASCIEEDAGKCLAEERRRRRQDQEDVETRQYQSTPGGRQQGSLFGDDG